ncbi:hypothetical protein GGR55DRAFT_702920 [Xylaria sp. FL0064]|nr:hypothetical protein GGR55DRAFT_702920 [Xylaria sp. FL0064]
MLLDNLRPFESETRRILNEGGSCLHKHSVSRHQRMLGLLSVRTWTQSLWRLGHMYLAFFMSFVLCSSYTHAIPLYDTGIASRKHTSHHKTAARKPMNFPKEFATTLAIAVTVVILGTTLICVFAHCWRPILDWSRSDSTGVTRKKRRLRKNKEAWFRGADRKLPMSRSDILEPEAEPLYPYTQFRAPSIYSGPYPAHEPPVSPAVFSRNAVSSPRTRSRAYWNQSTMSLPSWVDSEELERPASVAYCFDRP